MYFVVLVQGSPLLMIPLRIATQTVATTRLLEINVTLDGDARFIDEFTTGFPTNIDPDTVWSTI